MLYPKGDDWCHAESCPICGMFYASGGQHECHKPVDTDEVNPLNGFDWKYAKICPDCGTTYSSGDPHFCIKKNQADEVNHPDHYTRGGIECLDAIESALTPEEFRGYIKGNILKYTWREKLKNKDQDLKKAEFYLKKLLGRK